MKTYTQFIKEVNYSVYGQATLGSKPGTATNQQIKSGVDRAIKNIGTGKGSGQIGQKGGFGLSGGVNVSMSGSTSKSPTPTTTKTPPPTKVKPDKTKDPKPTTTKITPTTSTSSPSTNVLIKGSSTSSTSTSTSTQSPTKIRDPRTARISNIRMGTM